MVITILLLKQLLAQLIPMLFNPLIAPRAPIELISEVDMCPAPPEITLSQKGHYGNNLILNGLELQPAFLQGIF